MEDKRKVKRRHLFYYLAVTDANTGEPMGHAVNISSEGIMLISEKEIGSNTEFRLKMFLPEEIRGSRYLEFSAESRWCKPDENPDFFNTGYQMRGVPPEGIRIIEHLITKYCLDE